MCQPFHWSGYGIMQHAPLASAPLFLGISAPLGMGRIARLGDHRATMLIPSGISALMGASSINISFDSNHDQLSPRLVPSPSFECRSITVSRSRFHLYHDIEQQTCLRSRRLAPAALRKARRLLFTHFSSPGMLWTFVPRRCNDIRLFEQLYSETQFLKLF